MKKEMLENIDRPEELEKLYREDKAKFISVFKEIKLTDSTPLLDFWRIRLSYEKNSSKGFNKADLIALFIIAFVTGFLVKLPALFPELKMEIFIFRNLGLIVFNALMLFSLWCNRLLNIKIASIYGGVMLLLTLYINLLPTAETDSVRLIYIHYPLLLWAFFGIVFIRFDFKNISERIRYIRFNGELIIMTGLLILTGLLLMAVTTGLFKAINIEIDKFYIEYIGVVGVVSTPIVAYFLIELYPSITNKVTPVISRVFTPLILVTLVVYLISFLVSQHKIGADRNLLILFNVMLLAVMAVIVFSITELKKIKARNINVLMLFLLAVVTIVINQIALFAIIGRVAEGWTPNRTVVLISNILIFINLIIIAKNLALAYFQPQKLQLVDKAVAQYLPIYLLWTAIVAFILPFVFGLS